MYDTTPASERRTPRHLNMLMLQLGMNTSACISFATGESRPGELGHGGGGVSARGLSPRRLPHPRREGRGSPSPFPLAGCRVVPTHPPQQHDTHFIWHISLLREGLRRSRVGPSSTPRGFNPAVRAFGRAAGPGSTPRGAGVQPGGRTPIPQLVKNLQQK